jgi:hypothetical protein
METIQLQLDEPTLERAKRASALRRCTIDELLKEMIGQIQVAEPTSNHLLGMFADDPELTDQVMESAMNAREQHPLRCTGE